MIAVRTGAAVGRKNYAAIDGAKLIMALFVVAIHGNIDLGALTPVFRTAVPFFFLCSSYFLFFGLARAEDGTARRGVLKKFVKRNVLLYLFWLVVQLPMVIGGWRGLSAGELAAAMAGLVQRLFFGNTFGASWYLSAVVIGCCLFCWLSRWFSNRVLLLFGAGAYGVCLLYSSYNGLVENSVLMNYALVQWNRVFLSVVNGFPAGFLWIALGKYMAETPAVPGNRYGWMVALGLPGLVLEHIFVTRLDLQHLPDCYIMLIPICYGLFQLLRNVDWQWRGSLRLRHMSTVIYVTHGTELTLLWPHISNGWLRYGAVLLIAVLLSGLIFLLEKWKPLSWLRYVH